MRGCLSISYDFARQFLQTTHGWCCDGDKEEENNDTAKTVGSGTGTNKNSNGCYLWVNDRSSPIYKRADVEYSMTNGQLIDELIQEFHHYALQRRMDI